MVFWMVVCVLHNTKLRLGMFVNIKSKRRIAAFDCGVANLDV